MLMFWLLLNSACTASRPSPFLTLPLQRVGWGWVGGWDSAGTAVPNRPQGCSAPGDIILSNTAGGRVVVFPRYLAASRR